MKGKPLLYRSAEVNGTKTKSLRCRCVKCLIYSKRAEQGNFLTRLKKCFIGVLSDDFATVDFAKSYATIADRKSANSEVLIQADNGAKIISCKK